MKTIFPKTSRGAASGFLNRIRRPALAFRSARHRRVLGLLLFFQCASLPIARGVEWERTDIAGGPESGSRCAVAVDRAGRIHVAFVRDNGTTASLNYAIRANRTEGFTCFTTVFSTSTTGDIPEHIALDVGTGYEVQIACVDASGDVRVYQGPGFLPVVVTAGASSLTTGGISLLAAGNGHSRAALVYTAGDGSARYTIQTAPGTWSSPEPVTTGAGSGLAPKLIYVVSSIPGLLDERYVVVCYNQTLKQIQFSSRSFFSGWGSAVKIDDVPRFTRVGADTGFGTVGVAYAIDNFPASPLIRQVSYARSVSGAWSGPWTKEVITDDDELEAAAELFGSTVGLRLAADGNPWVAYTRNRLDAFVPGSLDLRARRFIPGSGWEFSLVETFAGSGTGFLSDCLALATNGGGDPALVYERDPGAENSTFVFARPLTRPWVIGTPAALLEDDDNSFAPAMTTGSDGTVHLVAGASFGLGTPADPVSEVGSELLSYHQGGTSRLRLSGGGSRRNIAHGITTTPDGVIHVVALRQPVGAADAGILGYWQVLDGMELSQSIISLTDGSRVDVAMASPGHLAMGSDAAGNVFLAFKNEAGGMTLARLSAGTFISGGSSLWFEATGFAGTAHGIDLAVRADGGVGVTLRNGSGAVILVTNMVRSTGELVGFYEGTPVASPPPADAMESTACLIMGDGLLRIVYSWNDFLMYVRFSPDGSGATAIGSGLVDPDTEMVAAGDIIHLCVHDRRNGGSLRHISFRDSTPAGILHNEMLAGPLGELSALGGRIAAAVDRHGFPLIAAGLVNDQPGGFDYQETVVARPADGLDADGDGIPLIAENAYQMNPAAKDSSLLPRGNTLLRPSGLPRLSFRHRYPDVPETPIPVGGLLTDPFAAQFGEFRYSLEGSSDLLRFEHLSFRAFGIAPFASPPSAPFGEVRERDFGVDVSESFLVSNPELFIRLRPTRDR